MTWRPDDKRGGWRKVPKRSGTLALQLTKLRYRIWCAELIGWPALADSFRRELAALEATASRGCA